mgnify:CR=1 FL=1
MALSYEDTHCEKCGKEDEFAWMNGGLCADCFRKKKLDDIRTSIDEGEPDTFSSDYIVCPYCGNAIDAEDLVDYPELYEDGEHELLCEECSKTFKVDTMVSYEWETHRMEDD